MTKYEIECYICGSKFELRQGDSPPKQCPKCQGTFLEMKAIQPKHSVPPKPPADGTKDIRRLGLKDL
jgi:hypothetical protein